MTLKTLDVISSLQRKIVGEPHTPYQEIAPPLKAEGKKCKQHHQETTITTDDNGGISKQVGSSCVVCAMAATGSSKHQAWSPMDHIEKILEDTCSNHTYPIKHKLKDCSMMKSFMTLGSLP
jgi:hypothetical protein